MLVSELYKTVLGCRSQARAFTKSILANRTKQWRQGEKRKMNVNELPQAHACGIFSKSLMLRLLDIALDCFSVDLTN